MLNAKQQAQLDKGFFHLETKSFSGPRVAESYSYRFGNCGWAVLMLDEAAGLVSIQSDYGDWSFGWTAIGRGAGVSLKEFMCKAGFDYLADKFDSSRDVFDAETTIDELKRGIIEGRRLGDIDAAEARELYDAIDSMERSVNEDEFYNQLPSEVSAHFDEIHCYFNYAKSSKYMWLRYGVLPALIGELKKTLPQEVA